jgi:hypothetical protein
MRHAMPAQHLQYLDDRRDAGLIISAQDGAPIAVENAVPEYRPDPIGRIDRVHVSAEKQGRLVLVSMETGIDISRIAADLFPRIVFRHLQPQP